VTSTDIADRYFASVRARDIEAFMTLFAEDATVITPDGRQHAGAAAIRTMENAVFASANPPTPTPGRIIATDHSFAVEIEIQLASGACLRMGSFYQINSTGLIQRLSVYRQG